MKLLKPIIFCIIFLALGITLVNVADLQKTNTNLSNQITQQEQTYSGKLDELSLYQEQLVARITVLEENYSKLEIAYNDLQEAYDQYVQDSTLERESMSATVVELNGIIEELETNADVDTATIEELRAEVSALETSLENQTTTANELQATVEQQEATIEELNATIDTLVAELNSDLVGFYKNVLNANGTAFELKPEHLDGLTSIRDYAFYRSKVTSVELPDSVKSLGEYCFQNASQLTYVNLNEVTTIQNYCFSSCYSLQTVEHGGNITNIGASAFSSTQSLEYFDFENTKLTFLGRTAFANSKLGGDVLLPGTLSTVKEGAFSNTNIQQLIMENTAVTDIPASLCGNCESLITVTLPLKVTSIGTSAFNGCYFLSFTPYALLPETLVSIGSYAFCAIYDISIIIPSSVTAIGQNAFASFKSATGAHAITFESTADWIINDNEEDVITITTDENYYSYFVSGSLKGDSITKVVA